MDCKADRFSGSIRAELFLDGGGGSSYVNSAYASGVYYESSSDGYSAPASAEFGFSAGVAQGEAASIGGNGLVLILY